ncbi:MAG TPA: hypothetical protein VHD63_25415 [Ktedonobacteraceae bacterium]|nr:hypothetical protein [Ktedonobacteraceae bacterium]
MGIRSGGTRFPGIQISSSPSLLGLPGLSAGAGCLYLVDWAGGASFPDNLVAIPGAFGENNGALVWTWRGLEQN